MARKNYDLKIKLKSYDYALLDQSAREIVKSVRRAGSEVSGPIPLPTKQSIYTVNRATNVNKKSREQFELRIHKRLILVTKSTQQTMDSLTKLDLPAGVDVKIIAN
ncbi:MAG: 30S ribosomal protein S10 [candidate division WOR-3 bacterium]|nr:30S ribosomal protein S10 [candidate division WOR-3 bacterium]